MYQLYYYPLNASLAPHFVLETLAVEYQLKLVDRTVDAQKSPDYLALNPSGRIPTLVDRDIVIFESAAICLYLADKHPAGKLCPTIDHPERAELYQWLMYLTNTLQTELMIYFYPERHCNSQEQAKTISEAQQTRITQILQLLDQRLKGRHFLVGDHLSICDLFLFMLAIWADELQRPPLSLPNMAAYLRQLAQRPSIKVVCKKEHFSLVDYQ